MLGLIKRIGAFREAEAQQDADLRASLTKTLYASPASLTIGAFAGVAVSLAVAIEAKNGLITTLAILLCAVAWARVVSAIYFHRQLLHQDKRPSRAWELAYELGAWLYAGLIGQMAYAALTFTHATAAHLLTVALSSGYSGGISGRNAGRVQIAVGQTCLALVPTVYGLLTTGGMAYHVLGVVLAIMIFGMGEISATTHRILVDAMQGRQEKARLAAKFERLAQYDSLTGVENRMAMQARLRDLFESNREARDAVAVLWLDLDRFKEINDTLGHMVGDQVLKSVVDKLSHVLDGRGHIARFGGDEFILVCPGAGRALARQVADEIIATLGAGFDLSGQTLGVTASIGIAIGPQDGRDSDELLQHADVALYHAKHSGRNRFATFTWTMKERFNRARDIETGLRTAIANGEMEVNYQPIFDIATGRVACCEALLRWTHPLLGRVSPAEFIPVAEASSIIDDITRWVLSEATAAAAKWPGDVRVAVNISPMLLKSSGLAKKIRATLVESGIRPERLELEVTESVFLDSGERTIRVMNELHALGVRLSLDDFGTGYSSLSYLRTFPFDTIKVDQSFMRKVEESPQDRAIIVAVAGLARALEMETVAEGIETEEQLRHAREAGFTNGQGYHLAKPLPEAAAGEMILARQIAPATLRLA